MLSRRRVNSGEPPLFRSWRLIVSSSSLNCCRSRSGSRSFSSISERRRSMRPRNCVSLERSSSDTLARSWALILLSSRSIASTASFFCDSFVCSRRASSRRSTSAESFWAFSGLLNTTTVRIMQPVAATDQTNTGGFDLAYRLASSFFTASSSCFDVRDSVPMGGSWGNIARCGGRWHEQSNRPVGWC